MRDGRRERLPPNNLASVPIPPVPDPPPPLPDPDPPAPGPTPRSALPADAALPVPGVGAATTGDGRGIGEGRSTTGLGSDFLPGAPSDRFFAAVARCSSITGGGGAGGGGTATSNVSRISSRRRSLCRAKPVIKAIAKMRFTTIAAAAAFARSALFSRDRLALTSSSSAPPPASSGATIAPSH